ncbi:11447_t:CDS:2 [Cetraspora pellucida]|uniref:11447_t:CDS:1 n=1 Tax=Cetraspora pellucida TaxID=1433469 RepID=A0ACA9P8V9_9GLOM|nr:11447_t:CDS:2 [Cetraspora pellucida]
MHQTKDSFMLMTLLFFQLLFAVNIHANSATITIPANGNWWVWSDALANSNRANLTFVNDSTVLDDRCGAILTIPINESSPMIRSSSGSPAIFILYTWTFNNKVTPLLNPNMFATTSVNGITNCSSLPCETATSSGGLQYCVFAVKNNNTLPKKIRINVPWNIECNSTSS